MSFTRTPSAGYVTSLNNQNKLVQVLTSIMYITTFYHVLTTRRGCHGCACSTKALHKYNEHIVYTGVPYTGHMVDGPVESSGMKQE